MAAGTASARKRRRAAATEAHASRLRMTMQTASTSTQAAAHDVVFLLDVDNTLLDNDRIVADLRAHFVRAFGAASADRYWVEFERLRSELGYADYLGALQRYRAD